MWDFELMSIDGVRNNGLQLQTAVKLRGLWEILSGEQALERSSKTWDILRKDMKAFLSCLADVSLLIKGVWKPKRNTIP